MLHDFRRTAARKYIRAGVPERVAMDLLGHKIRAIFARYNITSAQDLREAALRVGSTRVGPDSGSRAPQAVAKYACRKGDSNPHSLAATGF